MEILNKEQIWQQYPDAWVLIGNPQLDDTKNNATLKDKLMTGIVLFASKDKREVAYQSANVRKSVSFTICLYTGITNKKRYFLL